MSQTRERILDALEAVVAEGGPGAATLECVSARAGVSKGGLLYHFGTKEALVSALVGRLQRLTEADIESWRGSADGVAIAYLRASAVAGDHYTRTLLALLRLVGTAGVDIEGAITGSFDSAFQALAEQLDDKVLARTIQLVGDGLYLHALVGTGPEPVDEEVVARLLQLVRRPTA